MKKFRYHTHEFSGLEGPKVVRFLLPKLLFWL